MHDELSERAFRSARAAVITAAAATPLPPLALITVRALFGPTPPLVPIAVLLGLWCLLGGVLFAQILYGLESDERSNSRPLALVAALGLWFASTVVAMVLTMIVATVVRVR
ncbi:MAG: hypothetical protein ACLGH0_13505 [Thermoanaerobaculia bacterium]